MYENLRSYLMSLFLIGCMEVRYSLIYYVLLVLWFVDLKLINN